jgi:hypothetical protein
VSTARLAASFVVRVVVRDGVRSILLHDLATAATAEFVSFGALAEHLERASAQRGPGESPKRGRGRIH